MAAYDVDDPVHRADGRQHDGQHALALELAGQLTTPSVTSTWTRAGLVPR